MEIMTDWLIVNAPNDQFDYKNEPLQYILSSARIKLRHILTGMHLHSHEVRPDVEVSGYGMPGFVADGNDDWIVEIEHGHKKDK